MNERRLKYTLLSSFAFGMISLCLALFNNLSNIELLKSLQKSFNETSGQNLFLQNHELTNYISLVAVFSSMVFAFSAAFVFLKNYKKLKLLQEKTKMDSDLASAKLIQADKLSGLGILAGGLAHEINNPLAIIQGSSQQLRRMVDEQPLDYIRIHNSLDRIDTTVNRIARLVKNLKTLSKVENVNELNNANLATVFENSLGFFIEKCKSFGIRIDCMTPPKDIFLKAKQTDIQQVLINLLNNSIEAVLPLNEKWIELSYNYEGDDIEIYIRDSGHGIDDSISKKMFHPFFTTKPVGSGMGLGLTISQSILNQNNATLEYISNQLHTTFRFRLNRALADHKQAA